MKKNFFSFLFMASLIGGCEKAEPKTEYTDLIISKTNAPDSTTLLEGITVRVQAHGPNLCYKFSHFDVRKETPFEYAIFTKATFPKGNPICLQAIYDVDTSFTIKPDMKGQYMLRYHNTATGTYYLSDTVQVN